MILVTEITITHSHEANANRSERVRMATVHSDLGNIALDTKYAATYPERYIRAISIYCT